ncbi:MAG: heme ABC transporter permease [Proteobacteria bacterium]|nr:MAG: heme ABC transporter permease [Pseudomonadota bacterium]QKK12156.1 MAG: heme ABC transporter permease [Pseudomonadota bacterium]
MAPYHVLAIHFPIALWMVSSLAIVIRAFSSGPIGQAMDRALPVFLTLGMIAGAVAYALGLLIFPWETLSSTPMGRNHMLLASWSLAFYTLLAVIRYLHGGELWIGLSRWVMVVLAGIGVVLVGITGTLGGHLVGNYTEIGQVLRRLGWEIYSTYYLPDLTLLIIAAVSVILVALGFFGRGKVRA